MLTFASKTISELRIRRDATSARNWTQLQEPGLRAVRQQLDQCIDQQILGGRGVELKGVYMRLVTPPSDPFLQLPHLLCMLGMHGYMIRTIVKDHRGSTNGPRLKTNTRAHQDLANDEVLVRRVPCSAIPNFPLSIADFLEDNKANLNAAMAAVEVDRQPPRDDEPFDIDNSAAVISDSPAKIYEEYRYLRKHCPVIHTNQYGGYWLMTRYEDVKRAAMDSETYISSVKAVVPSDPRGLRRPPLNFDAPAHTPFRTALERTVKPARLGRLRASLYEHAEAQFAPLLSRGHGDISAEFAANFVARMESEWLNLETGIASELATTAASWLNAWRRQDGEVVTANSKKMYQIASDLLADRRVHPREPEEDPASSLLLEKDADGNPLSEEHLM